MSVLKWCGPVCAVLLIGVTTAAHAAAPNMKEGLWEITVKMDMPGMPVSAPPQVVQQCVTRKDMENPQKMAPGNDPNSGRCETSDYKLQGNTATWKMACKGENAMTGTGSMTFSGTSYTGTNKMAMKQGDQTMNVTMNYAGKHLGPCKK